MYHTRVQLQVSWSMHMLMVDDDRSTADHWSGAMDILLGHKAPSSNLHVERGALFLAKTITSCSQDTTLRCDPDLCFGFRSRPAAA